MQRRTQDIELGLRAELCDLPNILVTPDDWVWGLRVVPIVSVGPTNRSHVHLDEDIVRPDIGDAEFLQFQG
jgi:hypothetical protein